MQAIIATAYGTPDVLQLQEVPTPEPNANQILVEVHATAVTRAETMMRTGKPWYGRLFLGWKKPKHPIPGTGFAGVVVGVGKDVKRFILGDEVFGETITDFGTYAEYVCIDEEGIVAHKPANVSFMEAAPVGDGPITSLNFLRALAKVKAGDQVLINGASGSLGTAAIQLAKYYGAEVTAVCGPRNQALAKSLGADVVLDYTTVDFTKQKATYDIIYDTVGKSSFGASKAVLKPNGKYLSPVLSGGLLIRMLWTKLVGGKQAIFAATGLCPVPKLRTMLDEIKTLMTNGDLKMIVDKTYTLADVPEAHRYADSGHKRGNLIVEVVPMRYE